MRAKSLEDLIFAGSRGKNPSQRASVTLYFDNSENVFPGGTSDFEITRVIKRGGGGGYKMNGKKATRQQILNALAAANIDPDGSNQFVLQGKIVELTHMNPEDRRRFIEELIGLQKYDEMKDATLKELEKAERDLGQFEAIFKEVSAQLKKVEKEKNDALAWKELDDKINFYNSQLLALKIAKLQKEEEELDKQIDDSNKILEELDEKIIKQEDLLKQESLVMDNIQSTINVKEKDREEINETITQIKTQLSSNQTTLSLAKKSIEKLTSDKEQLEKLLMKLEEGQTFDSLIEGISKDIFEIENQIEDAKKEIEKRQQNQAEFESKIKSNEDEKSKFNADISKVKQKISSHESKIKVLKENIKKNEIKKEKLETELKTLKGDHESIEEARDATIKIENEIKKKIDDLKITISEENLKQRNLENDIALVQTEKNTLISKLTDLKSSLSSLNTEIKMNNEIINNSIQKKEKTIQKIEELSKGKEIEDIIKDLLHDKENAIKKLSDLKKKSKDEYAAYRKNEQNLELLDLKKDSIDAEINDHKNKISNMNTELKIFNKELTNLEREKRNLDLSLSTLRSNLSKFETDSESLIIKKENIQRRVDELSKEKETILNKIESSEEEYDKSKDDVTGILQILNMLTQNINVSVESIKANIQQSNAEAIEHSAEDFKKFVLDIIDIMKTVETINCDAEEMAEMSNMVSSILQTLTLFTDNADSTIIQLISKVKESADVAVQESTSNFDAFVMDLMEILENVHISLRKLTMSKSQELYKQMEEISNNIKGQEDDLTNIDKNLSEINLKKGHDSENLIISNKRFEEVQKRINEINDRIEKYNLEINERDGSINQKIKELEKINHDIIELKNLKDNYWKEISQIQEEIDNAQKEYDKIQEKLQELQGIQNLYEKIREFDNTVNNLSKNNENKKKQILLTEESIKKVESELSSLDKDIQSLVGDKEKFWEIIDKIQKEIDEENKKLEDTRDKLRALDNVMRIISSIEELSKENLDANKSIEESNNNIQEFNSEVKGIQINIDELQKIIDAFRGEKEKELEAQKAAQQNLNNFNKNLQKTQGKLNEIHKNKEREEQILVYNEEIKNTEKHVESIIEELEKINNKLIEETKKKDEKQQEIDKLINEKDESWTKQKNYQKIITDLKSDLSMENSKKNNYESKKIICADQIETLYERSKDYGTLPPLTEDLSEEGLQSDIALANKKKKALEPVNLKAIEQYDTVKERFDEIDMRRQTIQRERKSILDAIDKIELEKTRTFMTAYHEINRVFSAVFQKLSPGGSAKMILDRPDKPFEGGISIEARPRGKKISSLEILSGGEKTLVALSFIFAVQEFYPAPFYILDEIDAALDGPNVHRVSMAIREFSSQAQFLVISHREENIVNSDRIYGVSMQQSGITDIFSVDLEEEAKRLLELEDVPPQVEDN